MLTLFPAIDLVGGKAVRLVKGDYNQMTVYSERPWEIAMDFEAKGKFTADFCEKIFK